MGVDAGRFWRLFATFSKVLSQGIAKIRVKRGLPWQGLAPSEAMEGDKQLETIRAVQDDVDNFMHRMKEKLSYLEDARRDVE